MMFESEKKELGKLYPNKKIVIEKSKTNDCYVGEDIIEIKGDENFVRNVFDLIKTFHPVELSINYDDFKDKFIEVNSGENSIRLEYNNIHIYYTIKMSTNTPVIKVVSDLLEVFNYFISFFDITIYEFQSYVNKILKPFIVVEELLKHHRTRKVFNYIEFEMLEKDGDVRLYGDNIEGYMFLSRDLLRPLRYGNYFGVTFDDSMKELRDMIQNMYNTLDKVHDKFGKYSKFVKRISVYENGYIIVFENNNTRLTVVDNMNLITSEYSIYFENSIDDEINKIISEELPEFRKVIDDVLNSWIMSIVEKLDHRGVRINFSRRIDKINMYYTTIEKYSDYKVVNIDVGEKLFSHKRNVKFISKVLDQIGNFNSINIIFGDGEFNLHISGDTYNVHIKKKGKKIEKIVEGTGIELDI